MTKRKAEARNVRRWEGERAAANDLDEVRHWVVWGSGPPADELIPEAEPGNDIARQVAEGNDPGWADSGGWVAVVEADEDDIDSRARAEAHIWGYAPYLMEAENAASRPQVMEERLHGDRVKRRPFDLGKRR